MIGNVDWGSSNRPGHRKLSRYEVSTGARDFLENTGGTKTRQKGVVSRPSDRELLGSAELVSLCFDQPCVSCRVSEALPVLLKHGMKFFITVRALC